MMNIIVLMTKLRISNDHMFLVQVFCYKSLPNNNKWQRNTRTRHYTALREMLRELEDESYSHSNKKNENKR